MSSIRDRWRTSKARYGSFMSYSHAADGRLAPVLQRGIQRLGKPWYRSPMVRVFRDETSLSANPGLWSGIEAALTECEYFLLMCSPQSAASPWVQKEVIWWLANRPVSHLLLIITDGKISWEAAASDFDWDLTDCLPSALRQRFAEEPYYIDLRWAKERNDLSLRNPRFRAAVLTIAAALQGRPMEELDSEDLRQQRRLRAVALTTAALVVMLALLAYFNQRSFHSASREAESANRVADSRRMAAAASAVVADHGDLQQAILIAVLAWRLSPTDEARSVLRQLATTSSDIARILGQHSTGGIRVKAFTYAPDGSPLLVTTDPNGNIMLWHIPTGVSVGRPFATGQKDPDTVFFSTDASTMLTVDGYPEPNEPGGVIVTNLDSKTSKQFPVQLLPPSFGRGQLITGRTALSASGHLVAILNLNNEIAIWDTLKGTLFIKSIPLNSYIIALTFLDDSRLLFVVGVPRNGGYLKGTRRVGPSTGLWNLSSNQIQLGLPTVAEQGVELDHSAVFSPDGSRIMVFSHYGEPLLLYSRDAAMNLHAIPLPGNLSTGTGDSYALSFNTDGTRVAASWNDGTVVWDLDHASILKNTKSVDASALSRDGRWLAASTNGKITLWDLNSPGGQNATLTPGCSFNGDASEQCIQLLCEKATPLIQDAEELKVILGDFEFERLKRLALDQPCRRAQPI